MSPLESKAVVSAKTVIDFFVKPVISEVVSQTNKYDVLGNATTKYLNNVYDNYNTVRALGSDAPMRLDAMFVNVNIKEELSKRTRLDIDDIDVKEYLRNWGFAKTIETKTGIAAFNEFDKYIVLGKAGAGKTTYLKYLALQNIKANSDVKDRKIPIFIELKQLADKQLSITNYIYNEFDKCRLKTKDYNGFIDQLIENGKCLILFDGFDEVVQSRKKSIIQEINHFTTKHKANKFVISCRIAAYNDFFTDYKNVEIADFNDAQIKQFINNWFTNKTSTEQTRQQATNCWNELDNDSNEGIKELAKSPLLLTLLCINYQESLEFSKNRSEIYETALNALLNKWDSKRLINRKEVFEEPYYKKMSRGNKEQLFRKVAYDSFIGNELWFTTKKMTEKLASHLIDSPDIDTENIEEIAENTLVNIDAQHGILTEHAKNYYGFSHLTFQEYYTADYIYKSQEKNLISKIIEQHSTDAKWREVFLLLGEMLDPAETLVRGLNSYANTLAKQNKWLLKLLNGLDGVIKPDSPYNKQATKGLAIWGTLARALDLALDRDLDLALDLDRDLDLALALDRDLALALDRDLALAFDLALDLALDLDRALDRARALIDIYSKDKTVIESINNYLYLKLLTVQILKKCRVNKSVRQNILNNLLEPPE